MSIKLYKVVVIAALLAATVLIGTVAQSVQANQTSNPGIVLAEDCGTTAS